MTATVDRVVASDLAALATDVRHAAPGLDAILPVEQERTLISLATSYVDMVARAATGAALLVATAVTLVLLEVQLRIATLDVQDAAYRVTTKRHSRDFEFVFHRWGEHLSGWLENLAEVRHVLYLVATAVVVGGVARKYAVRRFARVIDTRDPLVAGRALCSRAEPWFIALWTSGLVAVCAFFATTIGFQITRVELAPTWKAILISPNLFWYVRDYWEVADRLHDVVIVVIIATVASLWVARYRPRRLRAWPVAWFALAVAVVAFGDAFSIGYADAVDNRWGHDDAPRMLAIFGCALALLVSLASFALRSVQRRK